MKRLSVVFTIACAIVWSMAGSLSAGALDRQNVQPRTNPVTQSMIRVPGVVGQVQANAMAAIQQVGLNVSVLPAQKLPKGMAGAAGMEGKVVSQTPTAGGMAMYGTTVTLYVWKPGETTTGADSTYGGAPYGTGATSPGYAPQTTYPSSTTGTVQGQYYQPSTGMGTQTQSSQPFQVQQYYYPGATGTPPGTQPGQTTPSTDPNAYPQGTAPQNAQPAPPATNPPAQQ